MATVTTRTMDFVAAVFSRLVPLVSSTCSICTPDHEITRSPICGGDNDVVEHNCRPCSVYQPATFRRTRIGRPSRSQWSPQHGRGDHGTYGGNAMYRGGQVIQDFGQGRDMSEDLSEMDNHLLWSSCRPHQVQTSVQSRVQMDVDLCLCLSRHCFGMSEPQGLRLMSR